MATTREAVTTPLREGVTFHLGIPVSWTDEMAQPVEGFPRKSGDVSLIPGTHVKEEGEKWPYRAGL